MEHSTFGDRMKRYELVSKSYLPIRTPVVIRIDGRAFHTFTRGFKRPFDNVLNKAMQDTMKYLCQNIQGCILGYTQSDEITLVLIDYQRLETSAWFDYNVQKCASVSASMATMAFNKSFKDAVGSMVALRNLDPDSEKYKDFNADVYINNFDKAVFDARVFSIPKEEVCNNILWRQNDAVRNSIQMVGRSYFSNKELFMKSTDDIIEMLKSEKNIDWNSDYPIKFQRGSCCVYKNGSWRVDNNIPIFRGEDRNYIESLVYIPQ
mgnify:CR=1 FL=1